MRRQIFQKVLILQTAYAGDVVLSLPMAWAVKRLFPVSEVHFLVTPESAVLLKNHPNCDRTWSFDKRGKEKHSGSLLKLARRLRDESFDLALVPHRSIRSALLVRLAGIPRRIGFDKSSGAFLFTDVISYPENVHEVERNLRLLAPVGWQGEVPGPRLYPGPEEKEGVNRFLQENGIRKDDILAAIAPGSVWPTKRWPIDRFAGVAQKLWQEKRIRTVLIGGVSDSNLGETIVQASGEAVTNGMGRFSFLASAELIRRCRVILANDSAPLHLAVAVGTPVVAIFGPTLPQFGFAPFGPRHIVIEKEMACRPCGIHGGRRCPKGHFQCMKAVTSEEVSRAIFKLLDDDSSDH